MLAIWLIHLMKNVLFLFSAIVLTGCVRIVDGSTTVPFDENVGYPTPASTLSELIEDLSSDDPTVRIVSIRALSEYGDEAIVALPVLVENLHYQQSPEVRRAAVYAIASLGPLAEEASSDLIDVLQSDADYHVQIAAAYALRHLGDRSAVPFLVVPLFDENSKPFGLSISCAEAIAALTDERFRDAGNMAYTLDDNGIPVIVIDARNWWVEEGQYQDWDDD